MKTLKFEVLKKNRKYFDCRQNGFKCKLKITPLSEHLKPGVHELTVQDVSIRTDYGTTIIFDMVYEKNPEPDAFIPFSADYNRFLVQKARELSGKWDSKLKRWVFASKFKKEIQELEDTFCKNFVGVIVTAKKNFSVFNDVLTFAGYSIAKAEIRGADDLETRIFDDVKLTIGEILSIWNNNQTEIKVKEGTTFKLILPKKALDFEKNENFNYRILDNNHAV